jgi:hypothetical protein
MTDTPSKPPDDSGLPSALAPESYRWPLVALVLVILPQVLVPAAMREGPPAIVPVVEGIVVLVLLAVAAKPGPVPRTARPLILSLFALLILANTAAAIRLVTLILRTHFPRDGQARLRHRAGQDSPPGRCSNSPPPDMACSGRNGSPTVGARHNRRSRPPTIRPCSTSARTPLRAVPGLHHSSSSAVDTETAGVVQMLGTLPPPATQSVRFVFGLEVPPPDLDSASALRRSTGLHMCAPNKGEDDGLNPTRTRSASPGS